MKKYEGRDNMRRCHDCGKPTPDYRCAECLRKWRKKYGVPTNAENQPYDVFYGSPSRCGGHHAHQE